MLVAFFSVPSGLEVVIVPPKGVPERRPLPVGRGGGAWGWRWGLEGGVGAWEEGPALPFGARVVGTGVWRAVRSSLVSISIATVGEPIGGRCDGMAAEGPAN